MVLNMPKKAVSLKVNPDLWKQARIQALTEGLHLNEFMEKVISEYLKEKEL